MGSGSRRVLSVAALVAAAASAAAQTPPRNTTARDTIARGATIARLLFNQVRL